MNPKELFFLDGLGGLVTAALLYFLLGNLECFFGMPQSVAQALSLVGLLYACYSFSCYFMIKQNRSPFLYVIAGANSLYGLATSILMYLYYEQLTTLGLIYFTAEIIIIGILVYWELKAARTSS